MIDPRGMTLRAWADSMLLSVEDVWSFGRLDDEEHWQQWAVGFLRATSSGSRLPPDPYQFADWREWAQRAYLMLEAH